jgi:NTE family protein
MAIKNLVFQGGGVKGIAYVGAVQVLTARNLMDPVVNVAGASAGAITAALLAAGATADELGSILGSTDFSRFMDGRKLGRVVRLFDDLGIYKGDEFEHWCRDQIGSLTAWVTGQAQPDLTFAQLSALAAKEPGRFRHLYVVATNLSRQRAEVFSAQTYPDVPVWKAVRMSMSIPFFFEAYRFNGDVYADGGISWNYPIDLFDGLSRPPAIGLPAVPPEVGQTSETLGFSLGTRAEIDSLEHQGAPPAVPITGLESYTKAFFNFLLDAPNMLRLDPTAMLRTVFIDNAGVATTDFDLSDALKQKLVDNGVLATTEWLKRVAPGTAQPRVNAAG